VAYGLTPAQGHAEAAIAGLIVGASQHEIAETGESHKGLACGAELHPKRIISASPRVINATRVLARIPCRRRCLNRSQ